MCAGRLSCPPPRPRIDVLVWVERVNSSGHTFTRDGVLEDVSFGCLRGVVGL